jgi:hypothetical protein
MLFFAYKRGMGILDKYLDEQLSIRRTYFSREEGLRSVAARLSTNCYFPSLDGTYCSHHWRIMETDAKSVGRIPNKTISRALALKSWR